MWSLDMLHDALAAECGSSLGFAFEESWLRAETARRISQASGSVLLAEGIQTPAGDVYVTLDMRPSTISLKSVQGALVLSGFAPVLRFLSTPARGSKEYVRVELAYGDSALKIGTDRTGQQLRFFSGVLQPTFTKTATRNDANIIADGFVPADMETLVSQQMLSAANAHDIFWKLVDSLPFPRVKDAMRTFVFGSGIRYVSRDGLVIVFSAANREKDGGCECGPGENMTLKDRRDPTQLTAPSGAGADAQNGAEIVWRREIEPAAGAGSGPRPGDLETPLAFYYPAKSTLSVLFDETLRPALNTSDSGSFLCFEWYYNLTAALQDLRITIDSTTFPPFVHVDADWELFGGAGVNLRVGCVTTNLLQTTIKGRMQMGLDAQFYIVTTAAGLSIRVATRTDVRLDVDFVGPPLLDILLNVVMDSIFERLIASELSHRLSLLNVRLVDLAGLGGAPYGWTLGTSLRQASSLIAIGPRLG